jgi:hypothetical protein
LEILAQDQINAMLLAHPKIHIIITSSYTIEHISLRKLGMILDLLASSTMMVFLALLKERISMISLKPQIHQHLISMINVTNPRIPQVILSM